MVERSWYDEEPISGCISDIVKGYNCLPRIPVFAIAKKMAFQARFSVLRPQSLQALNADSSLQGGRGRA